MCGRTACTLQPDHLVRVCTYKSTSKIGNPYKDSSNFQDEVKEAHDDDSEHCIVPIWNDAPCGGHYNASTNIPPTAYTPILYQSPTGEVVLQPMLWGLIPPWHKGPDAKGHGLTTNNCRIENVLESKLYRPCLSKGRCVVVCEGFYEWERSGGIKQPYLVFNKTGPVLYMAGLYSMWRGADGVPVYNYTIITRQSNQILAWLHHRMPAFLKPEQFSKWLSPVTSPSLALEMLAMPKEGELAWHPVSREVGNVRNQRDDLMKQVEAIKHETEKKSTVSVSAASKGLMNNWLKRSSKNSDAKDDVKKSKLSSEIIT